MRPPAELMQGIVMDANHQLQDMGIKIDQIYTDHGLPIDMALDKLKELRGYNKQQLLMVLYGAQQWLIEHRRNSAATESALDRQRKTNREVMARFIKTGESGVY